MSRPRLRDKQKHATLKPTAVASAVITVLNGSRDDQGVVNGATVEIVGATLRSGAQTVTNDKGQLRTGPFLAGRYLVKVTKQGFGPFTPPLVKDTPFTQEIDFLPNDQLQTTENEITIRLGVANPRVVVTVLEVPLIGSPQPLTGADVDVIGTSKGKTDGVGVFGSDQVPFGQIGVTVSMPGFTPETQDGPSWFQTLDFIKQATVDGAYPDFQLTVRMVGVAGTKNIPPVHPKPLALWLNGGPVLVDDDATLAPPSATDTLQGQAGWDFAATPQQNEFVKVAERLATNAFEVPSALGGGTVGAHQLRRLGIVGHGAAGIMDVNQIQTGNLGATPSAATSLTTASFAQFATAFDNIAQSLMRGASVYLMACELGDKGGEDLLRLISQRLPTARVVALRTLAALPVTIGKRPGASGTFPGLRDTNNHDLARTPNQGSEADVAANCNDLQKLPWFSETSTHATVFLDGNLIRRGAEAF